MNANVNYIGMVNLLCALRDASIISEAEARKIAARLRVETGADINIFASIVVAFEYSFSEKVRVLCVAEQR